MNIANHLKIQLTEEEKKIIEKEPELSEKAYKLIKKAKLELNRNIFTWIIIDIFL